MVAEARLVRTLLCQVLERDILARPEEPVSPPRRLDPLTLASGGAGRRVSASEAGDDPGVDPLSYHLRAGIEKVLPLAGGASLARVLSRLSSGETLDGPGDGSHPERFKLLESAPGEMRRIERELREHRADHAEVAGDLEAASVEWLRERQDAETRLLAYRDRARELKARLAQLEAAGREAPCLTCGRPLAELRAEVLTRLREEWETVVQDGSWWKRRREQLEAKPTHVRELEDRTLRLQASMEAAAERAERVRARMEELTAVSPGRAQEASPGTGVTTAPTPPRSEPRPPGEPSDAPLERALQAVYEELLSEVRSDLIERAAGYLARLSGGRVLGLRGSPKGTVATAGEVGSGAEFLAGDVDAASLALRLASALEARERGATTAALVLGEAVDALDADSQVRALEMLAEVAPRLGQVWVVTDGRLLDSAPESFADVFEAVDSGSEGWIVRRLPTGPARVKLVTT